MPCKTVISNILQFIIATALAVIGTAILVTIALTIMVALYRAAWVL